MAARVTQISSTIHGSRTLNIRPHLQTGCFSSTHAIRVFSKSRAKNTSGGSSARHSKQSSATLSKSASLPLTKNRKHRRRYQFFVCVFVRNSTSTRRLYEANQHF